MPLRSASNDPNVNFLTWKRIVGLPFTFPHLRALSDDELDQNRGMYLGVQQESANRTCFTLYINTASACYPARARLASTVSR